MCIVDKNEITLMLCCVYECIIIYDNIMLKYGILRGQIIMKVSHMSSCEFGCYIKIYLIELICNKNTRVKAVKTGNLSTVINNILINFDIAFLPKWKNPILLLICKTVWESSVIHSWLNSCRLWWKVTLWIKVCSKICTANRRLCHRMKGLFILCV